MNFEKRKLLKCGGTIQLSEKVINEIILKMLCFLWTSLFILEIYFSPQSNDIVTSNGFNTKIN